MSKTPSVQRLGNHVQVQMEAALLNLLGSVEKPDLDYVVALKEETFE